MGIPVQIKKLPDTPGIYLFYNARKELLYVGKATSLCDRVGSYFSPPARGGVRGGGSRPIEQLIHEVADIKWQTAESVLEAIILEANAIKKYLPKYNVLGKDDKSWNYIIITTDEYPRVETIRAHDLMNMRTAKNARPTSPASKLAGGRAKMLTLDFRSSQLFGPYPSLNAKATMKILRKLFLYSTCHNMRTAKNAKMRKIDSQKPCLYYQMGQCLGVCTGEITPKDYKAKVIRPLITFLRGQKKLLIKNLELQMETSAKTEDFEEAARLRNQIARLQHIHDIALLNKSFVETPSLHQSILPPRRGELEGGLNRIEGYDISNLGSTGKVGSMVVFTQGEPDKNQYRKFKIRTVAGQSDVDCLEEVIWRRLKHTEWLYPDLLLIDGGKPQVNRVVKVLTEMKVRIPVVGIAKGPERKRNDIILGTKDREIIRWIYAQTKLLIAVRNEAHRFAISYQRKLRRL